MTITKRKILDYIYILSISVFIIFICQIIYALLKVDIQLPDDYCLAYTSQMNDDDPVYCAQYKSKLIHAIIDEASYVNQKGLSQYVYFLNLGVALFLGFLLNYFIFKRREMNDQESKGIWINNSLKSSLLIPFLFLIAGGYFFPDTYYDFFVPETIKELRDQRADMVIEDAEWRLKTEPELYEHDPY